MITITPDGAMYQFKCVLLGSSGSGKSSIVSRYVHDSFNQYDIPTIGVAFNKKNIITNKGLAKLEIWDTAGQDRYESLVPSYYKKVDIAIVVYDTTNQESFKKAFSWINKIKNDVVVLPVFIVLGNKTDLGYRFISYDDAKTQAESVGAHYVECSAKSGIGADDAFNMGCDAAIRRVLSHPMKDISLDSDCSDCGDNINFDEFLNKNTWGSTCCG